MTSQIKHLNCVTMAPRAPFGLTPDRMVAHCLLVEGPNGLTLVDTGFGTEDLAQKRMGRAFIAPDVDEAVVLACLTAAAR